MQVAVTGDHSTPVLFGDHSHEPVPLAIAHVRHVVRTHGPVSSLEPAVHNQITPGGPPAMYDLTSG